jgi:hypothetical protein
MASKLYPGDVDLSRSSSGGSSTPGTGARGPDMEASRLTLRGNGRLIRDVNGCVHNFEYGPLSTERQHYRDSVLWPGVMER